MTFMKVPFTKPRAIENQKHLKRGSESYMDPWSGSLAAPVKSLQKGSSFSEVIVNTRGDLTRTPAVLPIPGKYENEEWNQGGCKCLRCYS
jgi:hypothetical protein